MPTFGSLFAGIGGIDLGLERAGWTCRWQVEIDDYCRRVLSKHWPDVPRYGDIAEVEIENLQPVDLIAGGFPCEDVSHAGRGAGIEGKRSGLWSHFSTAIRLLRPRFALVENVPGLYSRGLHRVLADLAASGYNAEWDCLPAAAFGAAHLRARVWVLAYPRGDRVEADDTVFAGRAEPNVCARWSPEPAMARVANGVSGGLARRAVNAYGRAVVPQVAEWIGRRILSAMNADDRSR